MTNFSSNLSCSSWLFCPLSCQSLYLSGCCNICCNSGATSMTEYGCLNRPTGRSWWTIMLIVHWESSEMWRNTYRLSRGEVKVSCGWVTSNVGDFSMLADELVLSHCGRWRLLSQVASLIDWPEGSLAPVLLPPEILLHKLTKDGLGWDQSMQGEDEA